MVKASLTTMLLLGFMALTSPLALAAEKDSSKPVEINSDSLSVNQEKHLATFLGNVEAVQGSVIIRSEKMIVHYRDKKDNNDQSAVSLIEVIGKVFLTTEKETASGRQGEYNVDKKLVTLDGNVILTQGKNVIKGDHLVYNMATGKSELTSAPGTAGATTHKGRVHGVFIPDKQNQ
ncbi:MAG: lipopolysaccharide transport periplasmic protein LptA [Alphaproteobacteria bacterium]|nr:lipopolysaccharide transport periplasmic protein LptA [Alphaproteobacteria bacterium]